jgi:hypothetical protein
MADVRPNRERLFDDGATVGAFLTGIVRWNCDDEGIMQERVSGNPLQEYSPTSIMDRFGEFAITDHIADLEVLIGNQVVRRDQRVCLFAGKIFALPLDFQMLLGEGFPRLFPVRRFLLFARETATQSLEFLFRFAVVPRVINGIAFGVSQEALETDIN